MKILFMFALLFVISVEQANAGCPIGTYKWLDNWGNRICKSFDTGDTRSIEGSIRRCPTGTYQWNDEWGNTICKSFEGNQEYYDTSKGCPIGTYEWLDNWGNKICKKF